ncbi:13095_t:CDS:2, partial [Acaulospora colombiana]
VEFAQSRKTRAPSQSIPTSQSPSWCSRIWQHKIRQFEVCTCLAPANSEDKEPSVKA